MGIHFYDECVESVATQDRRLKPARAVADAGIPCVIWAEDALSFAHFVPTALFGLQILVPDDCVQHAVDTITASLPYEIGTPDPEFCEYEFFRHDGATPHPFPDAVFLELSNDARSTLREDDPETIIVHPQSYFHINALDHSSTKSLVPPLPDRNASLRFPTLAGFFDSLISTIYDPTIGYRHYRLSVYLGNFLGYLETYPLRARAVDEDGNLLPHARRSSQM